MVDQVFEDEILREWPGSVEADSASEVESEVCPGLTFCEEDHSYWRDGRRLPSVTQVLASFPFVDTTHWREEHRQRGSAVHAMTHYLDEGDLDIDSVDPRLVGYLRAYERFKEETAFEPIYCETRLDHPHLKYAGTLDRLGLMGGNSLVLGDIKTGAWYLQYGIQLAAYDLAIRANGLGEVDQWVGILLQKTGKWKPKVIRAEEFDQYRELWRSCLNLYRFMGE